MSHRAYPKYKDSGVEWLGKVPEHWNILPLFAVMSERQEKNIGNKVQKVLSLSYGQIVPRDVETNFGLLPESFETYQIVLPENLVLRLTDLQNDKRSLRVGLVREKGIITSAYSCLEVSTKLDPDFAYLLLHSYDLGKVFYGLGGGVRQTLNFGDLKRLPLLIPPLPEQRAIASYLDRETARLDDLISRQQRLIELSQEKRRALISRAVTRGLDAKVLLRDSGVEWLGKVPEHWEVAPLKYSAQFYGGGTPSKENLVFWNGDIPWVSPKDMKFDIIRDSEDHITQDALESSAANLIAPGAVLVVVRSGILKHTIPVAINEVAVTINQDMKAVILNEKVLSEYLANFIRGMQKVLLFEWGKVGATVESIEHEYLANSVIPVPPLPEQRAIVKYLETETTKIDTLITKAQRAITLMQEHRSALIAAAVTGQIDVRETAMTG